MDTPNIIEKGTDAWNVAQGFTHLKILKPLVEMDKLIKISIYGTEHIEESLQIPDQIKTQLRIEAIRRLIDVIFETIENTDFIMTGKTKEDLQKLLLKTKDVHDVINGIQSVKVDQRNNQRIITINEDHFYTCLSELRSIKKDLLDPLNKKSLIFPSSDEIDLEKFKDELIFGG